MANFDEQIQDLVGTFTDTNAMNDWMTHGAKEIINIMPPELLLKCATETSANAAELYDFDTRGMILGVTRSDGVREQPCREIPGIFRGRASDSTDLMFYGTSTDPVFWKWNNKLGMYPEGSIAIQHISYPTITASSSSSISNFPDEVEYLVVLFAAIKAAESLLASEEDDDLYVPIINTLKADYQLGLQAMGSKLAATEAPKKSGQNKQMKELLQQLTEASKT